MKPSPARRLPRISRHLCSLLFVCLLSALSSFAKDPPLTAIVLFNTPNGAAYVQVTGVTLNGKIELRVCDNTPKFDKHGYEVMPRVQLKELSVLDRAADGALMLTLPGAKPFCVVPSGVKFDKTPELTPAQAADQTIITRLIAQSSDSAAELPQLKAGVELVFVAAPDTEYAEFLRAQRWESIAQWQD